jgi:hypothetical protein
MEHRRVKVDSHPNSLMHIDCLLESPSEICRNLTELNNLQILGLNGTFDLLCRFRFNRSFFANCFCIQSICMSSSHIKIIFNSTGCNIGDKGMTILLQGLYCHGHLRFAYLNQNLNSEAVLPYISHAAASWAMAKDIQCV